MVRLFLVALLLLSLAHKIEGRSGSKLDGQLDWRQEHGADVDNSASKGLGAALGQQVKTKDVKKRKVLKGKMQRNKTKRLKKKIYIAATTVKNCVLGAEVTEDPYEESLTKAYSVFAQESRNIDPNYNPKSVNLDGWESTKLAMSTLLNMGCLLT